MSALLPRSDSGYPMLSTESSSSSLDLPAHVQGGKIMKLPDPVIPPLGILPEQARQKGEKASGKNIGVEALFSIDYGKCQLHTKVERQE